MNAIPLENSLFTPHWIHSEKRPTIKILLDTEFGKEIRIAFKKNQVMKEHTPSFPIVVRGLLKRAVSFGVESSYPTRKDRELIALEAGVSHGLKATK